MIIRPLEDRVLWHVGEQEITALVWEPDGAFGPVEPLANAFDASVPGHECIKPGVEPFDPADRGSFLVLSLDLAAQKNQCGQDKLEHAEMEPHGGINLGYQE